jgi:TPR repeat protein
MKLVNIVWLVILTFLLIACSDSKKVEKIDLYRYLAEHGNVYAQLKMGYFTLEGKGVEQNYDEAIQWFEKAAQVGYSEAQKALGLFYYTKENYEKSKYWFQTAAQQGDGDAQIYLANLYLEGKGVSLDSNKGISWLKKSAEQAVNVKAQLQLGKYYKNKNYLIPALKYYKMAAVTCQEMTEKYQETEKKRGYTSAFYSYDQYYPAILNEFCPRELDESIKNITRYMQSNEIAKAESEVKVWLGNHKPQVLSEAEIL